MTRKILGNLAEKIFAEVNGYDIKSNEELIEKIEKHLEDEGWRKAWLSENKDDFAEVFVDSYGDLLFLLWTIEDELCLVDGSNIPRDLEVAEWFITMVANFFVQTLFPPKKILDIEWAKE
ncbi:MAG: hypothetical protein QXI11_02030 [Thermoproteota archaeon]